MNYTSYEELHNLIKNILTDNYAIAVANIVYLEELTKKNYVIYMTQFRDILTHLIHIYELNDIFNEETKVSVLAQLERLKGHLERIIIDSYQKICASHFKTIEESIKSREWFAVKTQIAQQIRDLRISKADIASLSFSKKKENFQKLIKYMESIINKFQLTFTD